MIQTLEEMEREHWEKDFGDAFRTFAEKSREPGFDGRCVVEIPARCPPAGESADPSVEPQKPQRFYVATAWYQWKADPEGMAQHIADHIIDRLEADDRWRHFWLRVELTVTPQEMHITVSAGG